VGRIQEGSGEIMNNYKEVLAIIPARAGSKRIPNKNIKYFLGQPLIIYTIKQALEASYINRVIVDTDSDEIATIAIENGAEVPFLRPAKLAQDESQVVNNIIHTLNKLKEDENYDPTHVVLLQTTSPLRTVVDIDKCWELTNSSNASTVLTVCPTHPRLYHLSKENDIILINGSEADSTNIQHWAHGYILNGCFVYIIKAKALLQERRVITKKTKAVVCDKWRSVDLDTPEDWVLAELLYKNRNLLTNRIINL
jgi:CMP-N,N'-diacetyllegionaminic acid synthase